MRSVSEWISAIGLALLSVYCVFALLFTAGGRDAGGAGTALMFWVGALGGALAVGYLLHGKSIGRWIGTGVYCLGAMVYFVGALVSKLPPKDRIFLVAISAANALDFFALYRPWMGHRPVR
jgi:hypothetical protein